MLTTETYPETGDWVLGLRLLKPVTLYNRKGEKLHLEPGAVIPLVHVLDEGDKRFRRTPFYVFHEFSGVFLIGRGHQPVRVNTETEEITAIDPDAEESSGRPDAHEEGQSSE